MSTAKNQNEEEILQEALRLLDEGASKASILERYPEQSAALNDFFKSVATLQAARDVRPPEELLRATLKKISTPIPSPWYRSPVFFGRTGAAVFVAALFVVGGTAFFGFETQTSTSNPQQQTAVVDKSDASDAALASDAAAIDAQLSDLDSDTAQADHALGDRQGGEAL
ncbi:MAG: hypothetical protein WAN50_04360 [Minisyncoccia bacterium]